MNKNFYVYILASKEQGTLYVGVTSDLQKRVWEHRSGAVEGFSKKYDVKRLVHFEAHDNSDAAIIREKQIKKWKRDWKRNLIEHKNPYWEDLYDGICN